MKNTMNFKKTAISAAVGAAAVVAAPSAFSYAYEAEAARSGLVNQEYHAAHLPLGEICILDCAATGVNDRESQFAWSITNVSGGVGATPVEDNITPILDASGNVINLDLKHYSVSGSSNFFWFEFEIVGALGQSWPDFDLTTAPNGKIIGGWTQQFLDATSQGGSVQCGLYDFDNRREYSFGGTVDPLDTCNITIAQARDNYFNGTPLPFGASISYSAVIDYVTCDTAHACGSSAKAVPVPAFAAAALGLGLVGVTVLTGRRKGLK